MAQKKKLERENTLGKPVDAFQAAADQRLETLNKKFEGKGRTILYGLLALVAVAIIGAIIYNYSRRNSAAAQTALGKAIEVHTTVVTSNPAPDNKEPTFPSDKERAEKAIAAFSEVANKYGSPHKEKAQYFIAVNKLVTNRAEGYQELENLSKGGSGEVATLSKFAIAEAKFADGKYDEALPVYNELLQAKSTIISDESLNYAIAQIYEKQGKKTEASDIYFNIVKTAREAKDSEGNPATQTQTAREAATKLEKLNATRYAELPPEPAGGGAMTF